MLQFILDGKNDSRDAKSLVEDVIDGGCRWVQVDASAADDSHTSLRDFVESLIPMLKEHEAFLVVEDDVDLVDELKLHGVFLRDNSRETVMQTRERLGAHAVIGVAASTVSEILALRGLDVDYVSVAASSLACDKTNPLSVAGAYGELIKAMRAGNADFHVVAEGDFELMQLPALLEAGCAGVAMSAPIMQAENPAAAIAEIIDILDRARFGNGIDDPDADSVSL